MTGRKGPETRLETTPEDNKELVPDGERKLLWLRELSEFIVEANKNTWAADRTEVEPERKGYKELEYSRSDWRLRDSFTGYFRAPGMTTVYFKETPVWTMAYGGTGMVKGKEELADETFTFLRTSLMNVSTKTPFRGPRCFEAGDMEYRFKYQGNIENFIGGEIILNKGVITFSQDVFGGLVINKNQNRELVLPWNL